MTVVIRAQLPEIYVWVTGEFPMAEGETHWFFMEEPSWEVSTSYTSRTYNIPSPFVSISITNGSPSVKIWASIGIYMTL